MNIILNYIHREEGLELICMYYGQICLGFVNKNPLFTNFTRNHCFDTINHYALTLHKKIEFTIKLKNTT